MYTADAIKAFSLFEFFSHTSSNQAVSTDSEHCITNDNIIIITQIIDDWFNYFLKKENV